MNDGNIPRDGRVEWGILCHEVLPVRGYSVI